MSNEPEWNEQLVRERRNKFLTQERSRGKKSLWWMSFADPELPEGRQFLGVIIVEAIGFVHAHERTHELGINPGGEMQSYELTEVSGIEPHHLDRLLTKQELMEAGLIDP